MITCPVAYWKQQRTESLAFPGITYREFDLLISRLCAALETATENILAFIPEQSIIDIAFFFAAWRMGKAVYPLSFRLPKQAIEQRILQTGSLLVIPSQLQQNSALEISSFDENGLATLIETSSSAKIACHLFKSHLISAKTCAEALDLKIGDTYCLNLPIFHISGIALFLRCFAAGATLVFADNWKEASHISMVPTQLFRFLEKNESLPKLKCLLVGGAPLSKALYTEAIDRKLPIYCTYGMTEASSMVLLKPPGLPTAILSHIDLKLSDEGEILLQGPSMFHHYWGQEARAGWFATRDIGRKNSDGEIEITGRKDRQFISGGENIIPEEIEQALLQLQDVIEVRVEPESDIEYGMRPIANLYCRKEIPLDFIEKKLEELLPHFKIPKKIIVSTEPLKHSKQSRLDQK